jgi:hypothetical protein
MEKKSNTNIGQRRKRAIKLGEELGIVLAEQYRDIAQGYVDGSTLSQLVELNSDRIEGLELPSGNNYDREADNNGRVAGAAIRKCLELCLDSKTLRRIGRKHIEDTAYDRSLSGVTARGQMPYENGKFIIIGDKMYNEIEYVHFLRDRKRPISWACVVELASSAFYPRTVKGISAAYSRWREK